MAVANGIRRRIGIDALDHECVDIVGDVYEVLERLPAASAKRSIPITSLSMSPIFQG